MADYDFSSLDAEAGQAKGANTPTTFGFSRPSPSKYDFSSLDAEAAPVQQARMFDASFFNPNDELRKQRMARDLKTYLGEDTPAILVDPAEGERKLRAAQMDHALREATYTRGWIGADVENARIAAPDAGLFAGMEKTWGAVKRQWQTVNDQTELAPLLLKERDGQLSPGERARMEKLQGDMGYAARQGKNDTGMAYVLGQGSYAARQFIDQIGQIAPATATGVSVGALAGAPLAGVGAGPGAVAGGVVAGGMASYGYSRKLEAAFSWQELRDMRDVNGQPIPRAQAALVSEVVGNLNAAIEVGADFTQLGLLAKLVPGISGMTKVGAKQAVSETLRTALANPPTRGALLSAAQKWLAAGATEGAEEFLQALTGAAGKEVAQAASGQTFPPTDVSAVLADAGGQAADAFTGTMVLFGLPAGYRMFKDVRQAQAVQRNQQIMQSLGDTAQASAIHQQLPEKFGEFVAQVKAAGAVDNVYIPAEQFRVYFQNVGVDPAAVAQAVGALNYAEALAADTDVMIPLENYAAKLAGSEHHAALMQDVRLHQGDLTARELALEEANKEQADARLQEQITQLVAEGQQAQGLNAAIDTIVNDVEGQLVGSGVELSAARTQAQLLRGVAVMAERAFPGQDPVQSAAKLWAKYGLTVRRDLPAVLTQIKSANLEVDPLLDMLRGSGGPTDAATFGQSLADFVRQQGGIRDDGGEWSARDVAAGGRKPLVSATGLSADALRELAAEIGYPVGDTEAAFIDALAGELSGSPVYSVMQTDERAMGVQQSLAMLDQVVREAGIDLNAVTGNAEVRRILEQSGPVAGARFEQPMTGPFGPIFTEFYHDAPGAIAKLTELQSGEAVAALYHPEIGDIDLVWGSEGTSRDDGSGLAKLIRWHPEVVGDLQGFISSLTVKQRDKKRIQLWDGKSKRAVVKLLFDEKQKHWLLTAYDKSEAGRATRPDTSALDGEGDTARLSSDSDTSIADTIKKFYQDVGAGETTKRGYLQIGPDRQMKIGLTESANLSTFLHETGHFYLEMLGDLAEMDGVDQGVKDDYAAILKWLGVENRAQIETRHHEMFARANEAYLMEGNAPAPALQGAFQRFKAWLNAIYRKIETLDVKLSPDVRAVFERIYATDQEIMAAQDKVAVAPLFLDAATAKMSDAEFAAYAGEVGQVSGRAREELLAKLMREFQRGKAQWWKDERAKVQAEVAAEVDGTPVYAAFKALTAGQLPDGTAIKLERADLVRRYGEDFAKNLPRTLQRVYAAEGGMDTDTAAEMLGFPSGDDLVKALADMRPRKALIEAETDVRMRERHGDLLTDGAIEQEAQAALHNDKRADVLMVELRALRRRQRDVAPFVQAERDKARAAKSATVHALDGIPSQTAFRRAAAGMIEQTAVRDLNPYQYLLAGRKAAKQAADALARQDADQAAIAKQRELLNHYLYLEATQARDEAQKIADYAKGFDKSSRREALAKAGKEYLAQIDALLERFELRPVSLRTMDRRQSLREFVAAREAEGEVVTVPAHLIEDAQVRNWREASMHELRGLHDALRNLAHLASFKNKLLRKKAALDFAVVRDELLAALDGSYPESTGEVGRLNDKADTAATKAAALWRKFDAAHLKVEQIVAWMDSGRSNGPWARYFFDLADDAQAREYDLHAAVTQRLQALSDAQPAQWRGSLLDKTGVRLPGVDGPLSRYDLISIALNVGTESNWQRLLDGRGWTEAQVRGALEQLSPEDGRFIQGVWDTLESLWPEIAALQERVAGVAPAKIEARTLTMADGTVLRGGYFPLVYDPKKSAAGEKQADATQSVQDFMARGYGRAATDKGHTKARIDGFAAPLLLDFERVLTSHLSKVIKDISHREAIIGLSKILKDGQIKAVLLDKLGEAKYTLLTTWEQTLISDRADTLHQPLELHNALFRGLRTHTAIVTMGWKISTAMSQFAGFGPSLDLVKPKYMTAALRDFVVHPGRTLAFITEKSGEMRHRQNTLDRDVKDALLKTRGAHGILVGVQRSAFYLTAMADRTVSVPTWLGGYRQALAEGMNEEDAVRAGDRAVRLSQGAGGAKDLAAVQRNSELMKLLTMYYTPFSVLYSRLRDMGHTTRGVRDLPRLVARSLALVILPAVLGELLAGRGPDDDEDEVMWAARKSLLYPFASMPVIRDLVNWQVEPALAKLSGGSLHYAPGYKLSPVVQAIEKVGTLPGKVIDGWTGERPWDDVAWNSLEASGYIFGLPTAQPRITGEYLTDLWTGDASPENAGQALHDVLFRRPPDRR
jgi:hypothetical protein